ncbi:enoyl-CoA hydratase/isomerase family protein [Nocardioides currus]|uniref:Enoyl-CoA hydratase n=1 Tax=Nocardioides currus TaxID=2133958 RepID=A0A2R7Z2H6_9ACTN|nr:enoyl-CoA hydratase-related protein [Nocardioides currus]PUA82792.1 enoyl-CoA hydratase [Nocardioides currus]
MSTHEQDGHVELERDGHVALITMRRPAKRNALNFPMRQGLRDAFDEFEGDPDLRCAVLTGEGACFSAGGDLVEMANTKMDVVPAEWNQLLGSGAPLTKPVVAAVNGPALAGGFRLAQDCDLCVAGEGTTFGITEAKRGRGAPWAAPLTAMVPARIMMELLLTGEPISAQRAHEVGLVNRVVADGEIVAEALRLAHSIAANAPLSVAAGKRLVRLAADLGPLAAAEPADWLYLRAYTSEDAQEGPRAFREKRPPVWQGR